MHNLIPSGRETIEDACIASDRQCRRAVARLENLLSAGRISLFGTTKLIFLRNGCSYRLAELLALGRDPILTEGESAELGVLMQGKSEYYARLVRGDIEGTLSEQEQAILEIRRKMD